MWGWVHVTGIQRQRDQLQRICFRSGQPNTRVLPQIPPPRCFHPTTVEFPTFKIFCKTYGNLCLTVRDGDAVLAPADSSDERQHWFKDKRFGTFVKDEEGKPAFSLINKATGLAVQHFGGPSHPVKLVRFDWDSFDNTLMWTLSGDSGNDGFEFIRTLNDVYLKLAAFQFHGVESSVRLSDSCDGDNHHWKILPWSDKANIVGGHTMRIYCKVGDGFSVTVRNGSVCLAPNNPEDEHQHWVVDRRYEDVIKDEDGNPAFALINKATGYAIKKSEAKEGPVMLVPYDPLYLDKSVLWSKSGQMRGGFHYIRVADDIYLNLDICYEGHHNSGVQDGTKVMLSNWCEGDKQYWNMVPWSNQPQVHKGPFGVTYERRRVKKPAAE